MSLTILALCGFKFRETTDGFSPKIWEEVLVTAEVSASKRDSGPGGLWRVPGSISNVAA